MLGSPSPQPSSTTRLPARSSPSSSRASASLLRQSTDQYGATGAQRIPPTSGSSTDSRGCSSFSEPVGSSTDCSTRSSSIEGSTLNGDDRGRASGRSLGVGLIGLVEHEADHGDIRVDGLIGEHRDDRVAGELLGDVPELTVSELVEHRPR